MAQTKVMKGYPVYISVPIDAKYSQVINRIENGTVNAERLFLPYKENQSIPASFEFLDASFDPNWYEGSINAFLPHFHDLVNPGRNQSYPLKNGTRAQYHSYTFPLEGLSSESILNSRGYFRFYSQPNQHWRISANFLPKESYICPQPYYVNADHKYYQIFFPSVPKTELSNRSSCYTRVHKFYANSYSNASTTDALREEHIKKGLKTESKQKKLNRELQINNLDVQLKLAGGLTKIITQDFIEEGIVIPNEIATSPSGSENSEENDHSVKYLQSLFHIYEGTKETLLKELQKAKVHGKIKFQIDVSFKILRPYVFCIVMLIYEQNGIPIGFIVAPSENQEIYQTFFDDLAEQFKAEEYEELKQYFFFESDQGSALKAFYEKNNFEHCFCHVHIVRNYGTNSKLAKYIREALNCKGFADWKDHQQMILTKMNLDLHKDNGITHLTPKFSQALDFLGFKYNSAENKIEFNKLEPEDFEKWALWKRYGMPPSTNFLEGFHGLLKQLIKLNYGWVRRFAEFHQQLLKLIKNFQSNRFNPLLSYVQRRFAYYDSHNVYHPPSLSYIADEEQLNEAQFGPQVKQILGTLSTYKLWQKFRQYQVNYPKHSISKWWNSSFGSELQTIQADYFIDPYAQNLIEIKVEYSNKIWSVMTKTTHCIPQNINFPQDTDNLPLIQQIVKIFTLLKPVMSRKTLNWLTAFITSIFPTPEQFSSLTSMQPHLQDQVLQQQFGTFIQTGKLDKKLNISQKLSKWQTIIYSCLLEIVQFQDQPDDFDSMVENIQNTIKLAEEANNKSNDDNDDGDSDDGDGHGDEEDFDKVQQFLDNSDDEFDDVNQENEDIFQ